MAELRSWELCRASSSGVQEKSETQINQKHEIGIEGKCRVVQGTYLEEQYPEY